MSYELFNSYFSRTIIKRCQMALQDAIFGKWQSYGPINDFTEKL